MRRSKLLQALEHLPRVHQAKVSLMRINGESPPLLSSCTREKPLGWEEATIRIIDVIDGYVSFEGRVPPRKAYISVPYYIHAVTGEELVPLVNDTTYNRQVLSISILSFIEGKGEGLIEGGPISLQGKMIHRVAMNKIGGLYLPRIRDAYITT